MRHALIPAVALALALAGCTLTMPHLRPAPETAAAAGLTADTIEVTPLDAAPSDTPPADAAPAVATPAPDVPAESQAQPALPDPVQAATPATPHPKPRPGGPAADAAPAAREPAAATPAEPPKPPQQLLCEAGHGTWGQSPDTGAFVCQKSTSDAGKICHTKGDCQGECLARSGTCAPVVPLVGCNDVLDAEGREMTLCLN